MSHLSVPVVALSCYPAITPCAPRHAPDTVTGLESTTVREAYRAVDDGIQGLGEREEYGLTKYSDVQISTGVSQWELPTTEAPMGAGSHSGTPAQNTNPYKQPLEGSQGPGAAEGTRGVDGKTGDRAGGLGVGFIA